MKLVILNLDEYNDFAKKYDYFSFRQTASYAFLKAEEGCEYDFIGLKDNDKVVAAALLIVKLVDKHIIGYIPNGMLIDYTNPDLLKTFTTELKKYCRKEKIVFVKINPPIVKNEIELKTKKSISNDADKIINNLINNGYTKLDDNLNFENILPRFNAIVNLKNYDFDKLNKTTKNKIRKGIRKGLVFQKGTINELPLLYNFVKDKKEISEFYYNIYYNNFQKQDAVDFFTIKINFVDLMNNTRERYFIEEEQNKKYNNQIYFNNNRKILNKKMNSDKVLLSYKNDIARATTRMNFDQDEYIAGALVIKHNNTVTIAINGYDTNFRDFSPSYYLFNEIINYYKNDFTYLDLNGISGDFSKNSKYHGLNEFKLGFNPKVLEYIGEFDLVINPIMYTRLKKKKLIR